jgi:2-dehydropantoate 2-reductase
MKITILGSGAIGGIAGTYMALNGEDVTFVDKNEAHVHQIREKGIIVDGCRGDFSLPPQKALTIDELKEPIEAVILATKIQHTEEAVKSIAHLLNKDSFVVSLQNGFNEELIASIIGKDRTIGALPDYGGAYIDPGHFEYVHEGPVYVGELNGKETDRVKALKRLFEYNTKCIITDDLYARTWAKSIYSSQIVTSALVDESSVMNNDKAKRVAGACVREILQLSMVMGIKIPDGDFFEPKLYLPKSTEDTQRMFNWIDKISNKLDRKESNKVDNHIYVKKASGIHWDIVYRNRPSEVRTEADYLIQKSRQYNFPIPLNTRLFNMIIEIENKERQLGWHNIDEMMDLISALNLQLP